MERDPVVRLIIFLLLTRHPLEGASSRYRIFQYIEHIEALGIECSVQSRIDSALYRLSFSPGRSGQLIDAYTKILENKFFDRYTSVLTNLSASQPLRPCIGKPAAVHLLHRLNKKRGMTRAATTERSYHLWWHPNNFGHETGINHWGLEDTLCHSLFLHDDFGMVSCTMPEAAK